MPYITGLKSSSNTNSSVSTNELMTSLATGSGTLPVGAIVPFVGTSIPTGMLLCDGAAVSRSTYAALFTVMGTAFGVGDGSSTFNLPNFKTASSIPIGKDSSTTAINAIGNSGGSFNHTHTSTAHEHSFTHSHDMGNHTHTYDHTHTMGNHTHTANHAHSLANHYHLWYAHGHSLSGLTASVTSSHAHNFTTRPSAGAAGTGSPRNSNQSGTTATFSSSTHTETVAVSASVGSSGTDMSVSNMASGSPRWNDGVTDRNATTFATINTGTPSTNSTGSALGSSSVPSTNTTTSYTGNTDSGGGGLTTSASNPPYVTVNFIIQAQ